MKEYKEYMDLIYNDDYTMCIRPSSKHIKKAVLHPNTKCINETCFEGSSELSNVILNENLEQICDYAFHLCNKLESIEFPDSLKDIGIAAFFGTKLKEVNLENTKIKNLAKNAFGYSNMETLKLPNTLEYIGKNCFVNSKITKVSFPTSLKIIYEGAFMYNYLTDIKIKNAKGIDKKAFVGNYELKTVDLSKSYITKIEELTFSDCINLRKIKFPNTLEEIKRGAFANTGITTFIFPNSIKKVDPDFAYHFDREKITIKYDNLSKEVLDSLSKYNLVKDKKTLDELLDIHTFKEANKIFKMQESR